MWYGGGIDVKNTIVWNVEVN